MPRSTWFCIDIECSGPVPGLYDMLSLGVVRVLRTTNGWDISEPYYIEFCPSAPHVDHQAMAVNGLSLERLKEEGDTLSVGLTKLTNWVETHTLEGTTPVFVGHNAPFDWSFVSYGYCASELDNPFGYKALDTKALAMGVLGVHWLDNFRNFS